MQTTVNILGGRGTMWNRSVLHIYAHHGETNIFMKRLCRVGKAVDFDVVISLRVLQNKISDLQTRDVVFKQEINDKLTELLKKVKAKEAAEVFAKRK